MKNKETAAKSDTKADRFKELGLVEPTVAKDILKNIRKDLDRQRERQPERQSTREHSRGNFGR